MGISGLWLDLGQAYYRVKRNNSIYVFACFIHYEKPSIESNILEMK